MKWIKSLEHNDVVHCSTREVAVQFLKLANKAGFKWSNGYGFFEEIDYTENRYDTINWNEYKERTCYHLHEGTFGNIEYFRDRKYNIHKAEEFLQTKDENKMPVLKLFDSKNARFHDSLYYLRDGCLERISVGSIVLSEEYCIINIKDSHDIFTVNETPLYYLDYE